MKHKPKTIQEYEKIFSQSNIAFCYMNEVFKFSTKGDGFYNHTLGISPDAISKVCGMTKLTRNQITDFLHKSQEHTY